MRGSRFALVFAILVTLSVAYTQAGATSRAHAHAPAVAPQLQATPASPDATPGTLVAPQPGAPVGEGTRQVLTILGLAIGVVVLIGGGIYLRQRWMATWY
jgi:hypothetical protein